MGFMTEERREAVKEQSGSRATARTSKRAKAGLYSGKATDAQITDSYRQYLGRDPDPTGLEAYRKSGMSAGQVQDSITKSAEYGERRRELMNRTPVDIGSVADKYKPYVSLWQSHNPGKTLGMGDFTEEVKYWHNLSNGNAAGYDAFLRGEIKEEKRGVQTGLSTYLVTPEAVARMGGVVDLRGNTVGQAFIVPQGAKWSKKQSRRKEVGAKDFNRAGFRVFGVGAAETKGLSSVFSEVDTVVNDWLPKELTAVVDPLGIGTGLLGGSRARNRQRDTLAGLTGLKPDEVAIAQKVSDTAIQVALSATGNVSAATAYAAFSGTSDAMAGEGTIGQAAINTALTYTMTPDKTKPLLDSSGTVALDSAGDTAMYTSSFDRTFGLTNRSAGARFTRGAASSLVRSASGTLVGGSFDVAATIAGALVNGGTGAVVTRNTPRATRAVVRGVGSGINQAARGGNSGSIMVATGGGVASGAVDTSTVAGLAASSTIRSASQIAAGIVDQNPPMRVYRDSDSSRRRSTPLPQVSPLFYPPQQTTGGAGVNRGTGATY